MTLSAAPLLAALVFSFSRSTYQAVTSQRALSEAQDAAALALSAIGRDLRQAGFTPDASALVALARAEENTLTLRADLNGDGDEDDAGESVSFAEDSSRHTLTRSTGAASPQPLADPLAAGSLRFAYFDLDGAPLAAGGGLTLEQRRQVKRIDVRFALAVEGAAPFHASASIELRNVR